VRIRMLIASTCIVAASPAAAIAARDAMHAEVGAGLSGKAEVPKGAPAGHGIVNVTLDSETGKVCWTFERIAGIGKAQAAHIHKAPAKKAGPVVVPLGSAFKTKGCTRAATKTVEAIEARPSAYYVNVHTKKYPNGAIRGQLHAGMAHM
jgi:CHRD domain